MRLKAVVFDLDGTLLDSLEDIADAANSVLADQGFPIHSLRAYRYMVGSGARDLIELAIPQSVRTDETVERCLLQYREAYGRHWNRKSGPYPGIVDMLDALCERHITLAVLSNKPQKFTELCMKEWFSRWTFPVILGASPERPLKPDPQGAFEIARTLNLNPGEFAYLGDTAIDMQTANRAGMHAVGALWGFRPRRELEDAGARTLIARPQELPGLF